MNLKAVYTVENKINNILISRSNEMQKLAEFIEQEKAAIEKAAEDMDTATAAGDVKAYQKAKTVLRDAEDAMEMHEKRRKTLSSTPAISQAEYRKMVSDIRTEIEIYNKHTEENLAKWSNQMEKAGIELQEAFTKANEVLYKLQHDVFMDANTEASIAKWNTINWSKAGVKHFQYLNYTGRQA